MTCHPQGDPAHKGSPTSLKTATIWSPAIETHGQFTLKPSYLHPGVGRLPQHKELLVAKSSPLPALCLVRSFSQPEPHLHRMASTATSSGQRPPSDCNASLSSTAMAELHACVWPAPYSHRLAVVPAHSTSVHTQLASCSMSDRSRAHTPARLPGMEP